MKETILITGACGQIGSELTLALREVFGNTHVIATDIKSPEGALAEGPFVPLDVTDQKAINTLVAQYRPTQFYHLAAMLSAVAEKKPLQGWALNMDSWLYVLEACTAHGVKKVFFPSSIGAFGKHTPKNNTPQYTAMDPATVYGISKQAGEGWAQYYFEKKNLDVRSIRYPGLISYKTLPGGGTTDYAIDIFYKAISKGTYTSFLSQDTRLPMMYMPDAIRGTLQLMEAPADAISVRTSYNFAGFSFTPGELAEVIHQHLPGFTITYAPDYRQQIADSWPSSIDDAYARKDWQWQPEYTMEDMVADMIQHIGQQLASQPTTSS